MLIEQVWNLDSDLVAPSDNKVEFYYDLESEVNAKGDEGFPTQIARCLLPFYRCSLIV